MEGRRQGAEKKIKTGTLYQKPSAAEAETQKGANVTQEQKILEYINEHGSITQRDAVMLGCYRLSARIFDLKKMGYVIVTAMETVPTVDGNTATIGRYSLKED